ncbi:cyclic-phosphate processing receiver domain-containing protein [Paenibacillus sp. CAU 1782]
MIHVYLDDYRACPAGFVLAKDARECRLLLEAEAVDILSLDFDLGWGQPTGMEVVRHIIASRKFPRRIYIHTSSAAGRVSMYHELSHHLPSDTQLFGGPMPASLLQEIASTAMS